MEDNAAEKASQATDGTQNPRGFWNHLTPWTVLGLVLTGAWVGILMGIERTGAIPEMDKLPVEAGALVVYVIVMASVARVAYKLCNRE